MASELTPLLLPDFLVLDGPGSSTTKLSPHQDACFSCNPPYEHPRVWIPDPEETRRAKTIVLCFDGTGDSFDEDVGVLHSSLHSE
jgi:uncharacterized Zn-finger protein